MYVHGQKTKNTTGRYDDFLAPRFNEGLESYNTALSQPVAPGVTLDQALAAQGMQMPHFDALPAQGEIKGDYQVRAVIPAIGISYTF